MQEQEPYVVTKNKNVIYRVYWGRVAVFLVLVSLAVLGVVLWFARGKSTLTVPSRTYWCVYTGAYSSRDEAETEANRAATLGGAGYVYEDEGQFYVFLSCYPSEEDAVTVGSRLEEGAVFALVCPRSRFAAPKKNQEGAEALLEFAPPVFDALYDLAIKTDKREISKGAALLALNTLLDSVREKRRLCEAANGRIKAYASEICDAFIEALEPFERLESTDDLPQRIKYALCFSAVEMCKTTQDFENNTKNFV